MSQPEAINEALEKTRALRRASQLFDEAQQGV